MFKVSCLASFRSFSLFGPTGVLLAMGLATACANGEEPSSPVDAVLADESLSPTQGNPTGLSVGVIEDEPACTPTPSDELTPGCRDYSDTCGFGGSFTLIMDLISRATPGCFEWPTSVGSVIRNALDVMGFCTEVLSWNDRTVTESLASAACSAIACIPFSGANERYLTPLRLACAEGSLLAYLIRCDALKDLCANERRLLAPHCPTSNQCFYDVTVGGCNAVGGPKSLSQ
jgi:hypothetical protein